MPAAGARRSPAAPLAPLAPRRIAPLALATGLTLGLALGIVTPGAAHAQAAAVAQHFDLPAQALAQALLTLGDQTRLQIVFDPALLRGRSSPALKATLTPLQALERLLEGSGLGFALQPGNVVVVETGKETALPQVDVTAGLLPEVRVVAQAESMGSRSIDRHTLDTLGTGNGDITSALRILPNIQYDNAQLHTGRQGELAPAEISIHGAKYYDNQFLLDGMSFSNDISPGQTNPNEANRPSSSSQGLDIDTSLLCNITVRDSNIPAEYGRFSGGVVSADTCAPTRDFGGQVSMEITRSEWMEYKLTRSQEEAYAQSTSDSAQPEFDKRTYRLALQGRPTENLGLIGSYVLKTSDIPLKAYNGGAVSTSDDSDKTEQRRIENFFLRGFWTPSPGVEADFSLSHAPSTSTNFIVNTKNSWFDIESGGQAVNLGLRHRHDGVTFSHRLNWSQFESSRSADASTFRTWRHSTSKDWGYRSSTTTWNSQEGQYGDIEQKQQTWSYQAKADWQPFKLGTTEHSFQAGLELSRQERYFHRLEDGAMIFTPASTSTCATASGGIDSENCAMGTTSIGNWPGQYLSRATFYHAGKFEVGNTLRAAFGQYEFRWDRLRLRLGLRYEDDDLAPQATTAPRGALFWDVFGDATTRVELGANRYYSRNFMTYYTYQKVLALQTSASRTLSGGLITDWSESGTTTWRNYRASELDVPYSDERMAGISQRWLGALWGLKWVNRESRDEVLRRTHAEGGWSYQNGGRTSAYTTTLSVEGERPLRLGRTATTFSFNVEHDKIESSHANYEEGVSDSQWDSIVRYDGKFIRYSERPADNYNRPYVARLLLTTSVPSQRLTIGNVLRYRDSYQKYASAGTADYNGTSVTNYELTTYGPAVTWDMRINYAVPTLSGQEAFIALSIDNVLNRRNTIEDNDGVNVYEKGRQFWLEFGYRF